MQKIRINQPIRQRLFLIALLLAALQFVATPARAAEPTKSIAAQLQPFVDSHTLAGAVTLVASRDKVLILEAVGFADLAAQKPMKTDALFWIASQSKPITGTALMMLVDEGKVHVDDPVEKYLPEFRGQMLGVPQEKDQVLLKKPARLVTFEPGSKYDYSNAGINTAGRIIEVVSGMPYEEFLEKRLFKPLGMKDTTFWPTEKQVQRLAKSYKPNADKTGLEETTIGQLTYPLTDRKRGPSPAGGYFSTATDMALFCRMVLNGGMHDGKRYLSEAAVKQMTSTQTGELPQTYGFGWSTDRRPGGPYGHGGAYSTNMRVDPERGLIMIFMVQHAGWPNDGGNKVFPTFMKAAEAFGK